MYASRFALVLLASCVGVTAFGGDAPRELAPATRQFESAIAAGDVKPHIALLAGPELRGRSGEDARRAAEYIRDHFERCGLQPLFPNGSFFQEIPGKADENGETPVLGRNVGALLPGSDPVLSKELVIVSAHYDHLGVRNGAIHYGADDNASGVSMMLEVARQFADGERPRRSIAFVGFDLEEHMLWGSRWFVAHPPRPLEDIAMFMTADMIGRSIGDLPMPAVFVLGSEHAPALRQVLDDVGEPQGLQVARLGIDLIGTRSDYGPFRDQKIPFLFFSTGEHPDYHTPRDVPARIDHEKVARVSGLVLEVVRNVANADERPIWTDDVRTDLDEARSLNLITTLLLESEGKKEIGQVQRFVVTQAQHQTEQILERGEMTQSERQWLIRVSQMILLSVF